MTLAIPAMNLRIDVSDLVFPKVDAEVVLEALRAATLHAGQVLRHAWTVRALELDIRQSGKYIAGIRDHGRVDIIHERVARSGQGEVIGFEITVEVVNTAEHASLIEEGTAAFRLPDRIDWSRADGKIKRGKDGKPYLSIPFRHAAHASPAKAAAQGLTRATVKAMMPREVYNRAKRLDTSSPLMMGRQFRIATARRNLSVRTPGGQVVRGYIRQGEQYLQHVARDRYQWGGRLDRSGTKATFGTGAERRRGKLTGAGVNPPWASSRFHGMVKMVGGGHTEYMTFRTITPDSTGWNIPAKPGKWVARGVLAKSSERVAETLRSSFAAALLL